MSESEKSEWIEGFGDDYSRLSKEELFEVYYKLYIENEINASDSDTLRTAAYFYLGLLLKIKTHQKNLLSGK